MTQINGVVRAHPYISGQVLAAAGALSDQSGRLSHEIGSFLTELRKVV